MNFRRRHTLIFLLGIFCVAGMIANVHAGNDRDRLKRRDYPIKPLSVEKQSAELVLEYYEVREEQKSSGSDSDEYNNRSMQEYFVYRLDGYVYHPRLLDFKTLFKLGRAQIDADAPSDEFGGGQRDIDDNENIYGYDLSLYMLKEHPVSIVLQANRDRWPVLGLFTDTFLVDQEMERILVTWKNGFAPTDISYTRRRTEQTGSASDSDIDMDIFQVVSRRWDGKWMRSEFRYRRQDYSEDFTSYQRDREFERKTELKSDDVSFLNTIYFSPDKRSHLSSILRYFDQNNSQDFTNYSINERLQLQHRDNLRTYYMADFLRSEYPDFDSDSYHFEAGVEHRLYRSLDSHLDVHWERTDFDPVVEDQYGVTGSLDYRKKTPWGLLTGAYSRTLDRVEREGGDLAIPVIDEPLRVSTGVTSFLSKAFVLDSSIFVTDISGQQVYVRGFDFSVITSGERTGLRVIPGGNLASGSTVLVDYRFEQEADYDYYMDDQDFYVRHDFEQLLDNIAVYYRWHDLGAHDVPNEDEFDDRILEYTNQMAGFEAEWMGVTWREEWEDYDSNFSSYTQYRHTLDGYHRLNSRLRAGWNAGYYQTEYDDEIPGRNTDESDFYFLGARFDGRVRRTGYWSLQARWEEEEGFSDREDIGLLAKLGFQWRKVHFESYARLQEQDVFESERDKLQLFFQLRREF